MKRLVAVMLFLSLAPLAAAQDQHRLSFLEQEVRNLQRQVQALSRQLDELRTRPDRPRPRISPSSREPASDADRWVDADRWRRVRPGMSELDLVTLLGPPTSMRVEDDARVLLYALEIGSSGFLGGSVTVREGKVTEVREPRLQ